MKRILSKELNTSVNENNKNGSQIVSSSNKEEFSHGSYSVTHLIIIARIVIYFAKEKIRLRRTDDLFAI